MCNGIVAMLLCAVCMYRHYRRCWMAIELHTANYNRVWLSLFTYLFRTQRCWALSIHMRLEFERSERRELEKYMRHIYVDRVKCQTSISIRIIVKIKIHDYYSFWCFSFFYILFAVEYKLNSFMFCTRRWLYCTSVMFHIYNINVVKGRWDGQLDVGFDFFCIEIQLHISVRMVFSHWILIGITAGFVVYGRFS